MMRGGQTQGWDSFDALKVMVIKESTQFQKIEAGLLRTGLA
jgi:hypothetical protein